MILSVAGYLKIICTFKLFESTVPEKAVKYLILSILVPLASPICLFRCRNQGYSNPDPFLQYQYFLQNNTETPMAESEEISETAPKNEEI